MPPVKHQVFVSSTFEDLKDERRAVIQVLLELDCIPAGMELFGAADEDQWSLIKRIIDECDYYLVVVGGRYGSISPSSGKSYTQMEYEYALESGKPILRFLHERPDQIPLSKSEPSEGGRQRLGEFRKLLEEARICKYWTKTDDLAIAVSSGLTKLKRDRPAPGWIKAEHFPRSRVRSSTFPELKEIKALGVKQIHLNRRKIDLVDFIGRAKPPSEIKMLGITMRDLQSQAVRRAIKTKLSEGCRIKLLLLDRDSKFVKERANDEIRATKEWKDWKGWRKELIELDELHQGYINQLPEKLQRKIKLTYFDAAPLFSLFMNGKTTLVGFYPSGKLGVASPYLELIPKEGGLHSVFECYFNYLWSCGKESNARTGRQRKKPTKIAIAPSSSRSSKKGLTNRNSKEAPESNNSRHRTARA